jgi:hypothetical protein
VISEPIEKPVDVNVLRELVRQLEVKGEDRSRARPAGVAEDVAPRALRTRRSVMVPQSR